MIDESRGLVESPVNMETGLRGYALNGKEDMLQPFTLGQKAFMEHLEKAKQLTSDNPVQQDRWRVCFSSSRTGHRISPRV